MPGFVADKQKKKRLGTPGFGADKKKKKSLGAPPALLRFAPPKV